MVTLPDNADVKPFADAALSSLLVGRFGPLDPNFFAVRAEAQESTGDPTPYMVILSAWVNNQSHPYLCDPAMQTVKVLDLGVDWSVDVLIDETSPSFEGDPGTNGNPGTVLIRAGTDFFIRLCKGQGPQGYLDLATGVLIYDPGAAWPGTVFWSAFAIYLPQPGVDGPGAEIFRWPHI